MKMEKEPPIYDDRLVDGVPTSKAGISFTSPILFFLAAIINFGVAIRAIQRIPADLVVTNKAFLRKPSGTYYDDESSSYSDDDSLGLAWLMSFPNSGTSYTSELVRTATRRKTASNYRTEGGAGKAVSVFQNSQGPFWTEFDNEEATLPTNGYLLTKTHCGGYCDQCPPEKYVENSQSFLQKCLGSVYKGDVRDSYGLDLVQRAVHLIRDPLDNIVSRFHLARKNCETCAVYPKSREGFRAYCAAMSDKFHKQEQDFSEVFKDVKDVPCYADFFRYIQWHNYAFHTTLDLGMPTMIIHYENYTHSFEETKDSLLEWLGQEAIAEPPRFDAGKTYREYFTQEEIQAVADMFAKFASITTLEHTKHYF